MHILWIKDNLFKKIQRKNKNWKKGNLDNPIKKINMFFTNHNQQVINLILLKKKMLSAQWKNLEFNLNQIL